MVEDTALVDAVTIDGFMDVGRVWNPLGALEVWMQAHSQDATSAHPYPDAHGHTTDVPVQAGAVVV